MDGELIRVSGFDEAVSLKDSETAFFAGGTGICYKDSGICAKKYIVIPDEEQMHTVTIKDGLVQIGALVTFTQALEEEAVPAYLKEAILFCGSLQKRNRATIGGNVASWRSDSYLVPTLIASGAKLSLMGKEGILLEEIGQYAADREKYSDALITGILVKPDEQVQILAKRYANTVESHACLTIAMGKEGDTYRIGLAIKNSGIFLPDITNWGISWKKAGVQDDMFGSEEYKRYLTETTLDTMYEKLGGEGGTES